MSVVKFDFSVGDCVIVSSVDIKGVIDAMMISAGCDKEYRIVYWSNGDRYVQWMYGREIRK